MNKRVTIIAIIFFLMCITDVTATPKFCSECGTALNAGSKFCSGCGISLEGNTAKQNNDDSMKEKIESLFAPVDEFTIYLSSSNFVTCIAKYPEYIIRMNKNRKEIDKIICDAVTRKVIQCYFSHWDILCDLMEKWNKNKSLEYEYKCKMRLTHIANVKKIWKNGGTLADIEKSEKIYENATKDFTVNTKFLAVKEKVCHIHQIRAYKDTRFIVVSVNKSQNEATILFISGSIHSVAPLNAYAYVEDAFTSLFHVNNEELIKRSTCTKEDLQYFEQL